MVHEGQNAFTHDVLLGSYSMVSAVARTTVYPDNLLFTRQKLVQGQDANGAEEHAVDIRVLLLHCIRGTAIHEAQQKVLEPDLDIRERETRLIQTLNPRCLVRIHVDVHVRQMVRYCDERAEDSHATFANVRRGMPSMLRIEKLSDMSKAYLFLAKTQLTCSSIACKKEGISMEAPGRQSEKMRSEFWIIAWMMVELPEERP